MRYLTKAQIESNKKHDRLIKAKKICFACGQYFSKVKRSKRLHDICEECEKAID